MKRHIHLLKSMRSFPYAGVLCLNLENLDRVTIVQLEHGVSKTE